jgi:hypothetical protein
MGYDLKYLLELGVLLVALAATFLLVPSLCGYRAVSILDSREWKILGKLVAALSLLFLFLIRMIYLDLPSELFIYGRF